MRTPSDGIYIEAQGRTGLLTNVKLLPAWRGAIAVHPERGFDTYQDPGFPPG